MTHISNDETSDYWDIVKPANKKRNWDHDYYNFIDLVDKEALRYGDLSERPNASDVPDGRKWIDQYNIVHEVSGSSWNAVGFGDASNPFPHSVFSSLASQSAPSSSNEVVRKNELDPVESQLDNHSSRHESGGADEISVEGLAGDLADAQDPKDHNHLGDNLNPDSVNNKDYNEDVESASAVSGTYNLDLSVANWFEVSLDGNVDFSITATGNQGNSLILYIEQSSSSQHTVNWPSGVQWTDGNPPDPPQTGEDMEVTFRSPDGGSIWRGTVSGRRFAQP